MFYIIPTPIGNLEDITIRAVRLLSSVDLIICEDTRKIKQLLRLLDIQTPAKFVNYLKNHQFNEGQIVNALQSDYQNIAFVTDAGTPAISDPGFLMLGLLQTLNIDYTVLPGATAIIPAIVASGFVSKEFLFLGFLPTKKGRKKEWEKIANSLYPVVFYESVHRIEKFIAETSNYLQPDRKICICRELSKKFEEIIVCSVRELAEKKILAKGEFAIVIDKNSKNGGDNQN
jgi:16S rRNA (cytidine1402-2'-O)-methyltransferase